MSPVNFSRGDARTLPGNEKPLTDQLQLASYIFSGTIMHCLAGEAFVSKLPVLIPHDFCKFALNKNIEPCET